MKISRQQLALVTVSAVLFLTAAVAVALPPQCSQICNRWTPPETICALGGTVTTCGELLLFAPATQPEGGQTLALMPIDQFLSTAPAADCSGS